MRQLVAVKMVEVIMQVWGLDLALQKTSIKDEKTLQKTIGALPVLNLQPN